jgi:nitroreductase
MDVRTALATRKSIRAFADRPVSTDLVTEILELSARAPSGANLQPWHVYALVGQAREALIQRVKLKLADLPRGEPPEYHIHPPGLCEPYSSRYFRAAALMYGSIGIARDDMAARQRHLAKNWEFFGAPVGLIFTIHRLMEPGQWADLGMYMKSAMLLARDYGLDTCAQEAWALWPQTLREYLPIPDDHMVVCGMAIGYADRSASINAFASERAPLREYATILDTIDSPRTTVHAAKGAQR